VKYAAAAVIAWFVAVANVSGLAYISVLGVTPDFVLIFACCWAVVRSEEEALIVVPLCGLMRDLAGSDPTGTAIIGFAPIVLLASFAHTRVIESDFPPAIGAVAGGTLIFLVFQSLVLGATGHDIAVWHLIRSVIVPSVIVNALFTPIIYLPVRWFSPPRPLAMQGGRRLTATLTSRS